MDFEKLLKELQYCGYGWLRPEGVRKKLEEMTTNWQGPPSSRVLVPEKINDVNESIAKNIAKIISKLSSINTGKPEIDRRLAKIVRGSQFLPVDKQKYLNTLIEFTRNIKIQLILNDKNMLADEIGDLLNEIEQPGGTCKKPVEMTAKGQGPPAFPRSISGDKFKLNTPPKARPQQQHTISTNTGRPSAKELTEKAKAWSQRIEKEKRNTDGKTLIPDRNDPCPCGSGKKYKKCCGRSENKSGEGVQVRRRIKCSCGFENPSTNIFCSKCGLTLGVGNSMRCSYCNETIPKGMKFCIHCGKSIC